MKLLTSSCFSNEDIPNACEDDSGLSFTEVFASFGSLISHSIVLFFFLLKPWKVIPVNYILTLVSSSCSDSVFIRLRWPFSGVMTLGIFLSCSLFFQETFKKRTFIQKDLSVHNLFENDDINETR